MKTKKILLFLLAVSVGVLLQQNKNFVFVDTVGVSEEEKGISLSPYSDSGAQIDHFNFEADAGEVVHGKVIVVNPNKYKTVIAELYALNAMAPNGNFFVMSDDSPKEQAEWFHFAQSQVTLKPQTNMIVPFDVLIPKMAPSGKYIVALTGKVKKADSGSVSLGGIGLNVATRVAIPANLKVKKGLATSATIGKAFIVEKHPITVGVPFTNTGDAILKPVVYASVFDEQGATITTLQGKGLYEIGLQETKNLEVQWLDALSGTYTFKLTVAYSGKSFDQKLTVAVDAPPSQKMAAENPQPQGGVLPAKEGVIPAESGVVPPQPGVMPGEPAAPSSLQTFVLLGIIALMGIGIGILMWKRKKSVIPQSPLPPS